MHALRSRLPAAPKRARTGAHLAVRGERRAAKQSKAKQSRGKAKGRAKVPSAPPKAPPRRFAAHTRRPVRPTRGETRIAPPRRGNGRRPHTHFLPTKTPKEPGAAARGAARPRAEGALGSPLPPDWLKRMAFTGGSRQRDARDAMPVRARRRRVREKHATACSWRRGAPLRRRARRQSPAAAPWARACSPPPHLRRAALPGGRSSWASWRPRARQPAGRRLPKRAAAAAPPSPARRRAEAREHRATRGCAACPASPRARGGVVDWLLGNSAPREVTSAAARSVVCCCASQRLTNERVQSLRPTRRITDAASQWWRALRSSRRAVAPFG